MRHSIQLERAGEKTEVSCACGKVLGLYPPEEGSFHLAVFRNHVREAAGVALTQDSLQG